MFNTLKNSKLFYLLGGLGAFVAMCLLQIPLSVYFLGTWHAVKALAISFAIGLVMLVFVAWAVINVLDGDIDTRRFLTYWRPASVLFLLAYFLPLTLFSYKVVGWLGFYSGLIALAAIGFSVLLTVSFAGKSAIGKKAVAIIFCVIYIGAYGYGVYYASTTVSQASMNVVDHFEVLDTLPRGAGEKVKVVLLNGQSNASGVSSVEYLGQKADAADYARYTSGYENVYINYFDDNGNNTSGGAFVHVTAGQGCMGTKQYFGPELGLADALSARFPGEKIFIIKYAWGGSNLNTQWLAPSSEGKTGYMYTAFVNFTKGSLEYLKSKNYDPEIYAMCWMQGESDSITPDDASKYGARSRDLIADVRVEFADYASEKGITFVDAGISNSPYWTLYEQVNAAKAQNAAADEKYVYIDTIGAELEYTQEPEANPDMAHYDALSMIKLGNLFAAEVIKTME